MLFPSCIDEWEGIVFSRTERRAPASPARGDVSGWIAISLLPGVSIQKVAN